MHKAHNSIKYTRTGIHPSKKSLTFLWNVGKRYHNKEDNFYYKQWARVMSKGDFLFPKKNSPFQIRRWAGTTGCAAAPKKRNEKNFDNTLQNQQVKFVLCS